MVGCLNTGIMTDTQQAVAVRARVGNIVRDKSPGSHMNRRKLLLAVGAAGQYLNLDETNFRLSFRKPGHESSQKTKFPNIIHNIDNLSILKKF